MNRGFGYYFKKSNDVFSFVIRKQKFSNRLSLLIYTVMSFLGKMFLFTRPIFLIADQNMANMMANGHSFVVLKAFHGIKERYGKMLLESLVEFFIYLAIALVIFLPISIFLIGRPMVDVFYIVIFSIAGVAYFVIAFLVSLNYSFVPFVASINKDLDFSDYLYNSRISMRGCRGQIFLNGLLRYLLGRFWCDIVLVVAFVIGFVDIDNNIKFVVFIILAIAYPVLYFFLVPRAEACKNLFVFLLGDDACRKEGNIVVRRRASTNPEYEPLFEQEFEESSVNLNKENK